MTLRTFPIWLYVAAGACVGACGGTEAKADVEPTDVVLDAEPADTEPDLEAEDVAIVDGPADVSAQDTPDITAPQDVPDVPDIAQCQIDDDCTTQVTLSPCELAICTAGVCGKTKNPAACCLDSDCDDKQECTLDKCDQLKHTCNNVSMANCCSGKVLLQSAGFETGPDGFSSSTTFILDKAPSTGNVTWQNSTKRAHGGSKSLYFGNDCSSYDASMTVSGACKPAPQQSKIVTTTLTSKAWQLPKSLQAQAHFWLWLETEPSYAKTLPPGTCDPPCNVYSTCIFVAGSSVCEPEKDVLSVQVLTADAPPAPVFVSTTIGKTTLGDPQRPDGWLHVAIDLAPWKGKSVQLALQFGTLTALKNGFEGIYIDDLVVETICANDGIICALDDDCGGDGLPCTQDTCTAYANAQTEGSGVCFHDNIAGCCLGSADCEDGNGCTQDVCTSNVCTHAPDTAQPGCCTPATLQSSDFNGGDLSGWVPVATNSLDVKWRLATAGGNPASAGGAPAGGALYFGNAAQTNYADPLLPGALGPEGMMCAKSLALQSGTKFNLLKFDLNMDTEWSDVGKGLYVNPPVPAKPRLDWFAVQVFTQGKYDTAWSSDSVAGTTQGQWQTITVSLDPWAGKAVQVCLRFETGDNVLNQKPGVFVDNVSLSVACQKSACYWDQDCTAKTCGSCEAPVCAGDVCACAPLTVCPPP